MEECATILHTTEPIGRNKLWNCLKDIHAQKPNNHKINEIKTAEGCITSDLLEMAENYNTFFSKIGSILANKIVAHPNYTYTQTTLSNTFYLERTTKEEVKQIINQLKRGKSPGIDGIKSETVQEIVEFIITPLTFVINLSMETGVFHNSLKRR